MIQNVKFITQEKRQEKSMNVASEGQVKCLDLFYPKLFKRHLFNICLGQIVFRHEELPGSVISVSRASPWGLSVYCWIRLLSTQTSYFIQQLLHIITTELMTHDGLLFSRSRKHTWGYQTYVIKNSSLYEIRGCQEDQKELLKYHRKGVIYMLNHILKVLEKKGRHSGLVGFLKDYVVIIF